jgi:hypothetical protein
VPTLTSIGNWAIRKIEVDAKDGIAYSLKGCHNPAPFSTQGRPHTALDGQTPDMVYFAPLPQREAAERELRRASRSTPRFLSNSLGPPLMAREGAARKPRGGFPASMIGEATCEDQADRAP